MRRGALRWLDLSGLGLLSPTLLVLLALFVEPLLVLLPSSFHRYVPDTGIGSEWTISNYVQILGDPFHIEIIGRTLALGLVAGGIFSFIVSFDNVPVSISSSASGRPRCRRRLSRPSSTSSTQASPPSRPCSSS